MSPEQFARRMLRVIGDAILEQARSNLQSMATDSRRAQSLREDLQVQVVNVDDEASKLEVSTDYYWAIYYHDGRGPIRAKPGKFLVFFKDPDDDPRHDGSARNYPRRMAGIRRLDLPRAEFFRLLQTGKLIATKRVGPAGPHPFLERGFNTVFQKVGPSVQAIFSNYVLGELADAGVLSIDETIRIDL